MSDYIDGVHVTEFLDNSLEPHCPSPGGGDKKRAANPYLRNKRPSKKIAPAAAVVSVPPAAQVDSDEGDELYYDSLGGVVEVSAVTPGDTTPAVSHAPNVARTASPVPLAAHHEPDSQHPTPRAARALFETPDPTVNALVVAEPQVQQDNNPNSNAIVPAANNNSQRTVKAILPGDWRFTVHNMKQSDKFGKLFSTIARKSDAWCSGLQTMEAVTTYYSSRALSVLDDPDDEDAVEIFGIEGVSNHMTTNMSPLLNTVLGESLTYMGITSPMQSTDLYSFSDDNQVVMSNKGVDLVGYVFPRTGDSPAKYNKAGQTMEHPAFWDNHLEWKQKPQGGKTCFMDLCFNTPLGFLKESDRTSHRNGLKSLSASPMGPVIKGNWLELCLYDDVARAFKNIMMSPIIVKGYKYGWFPVIAMKNGLLQRTPYAVNGWRLCSCSIHQKSYLSVVGFVKMYSKTDVDDIGLLGVNVAGKPISHKEAKGAIEHSD